MRSGLPATLCGCGWHSPIMTSRWPTKKLHAGQAPSFGGIWSHHDSPTSIHPNLPNSRSFFDSTNQFFSNLQFKSGLNADANVGIRFADDPAMQRDTILKDLNEQNHRFINPVRISGRTIPSFLSAHAVSYTHLRAHETGRNLVC